MTALNEGSGTQGAAGAPLIVQIYDQPFRIGSSSTDDDQIRHAAAYLDEKMRKLASRRGRGVALELAILAAMEIADEMLIAQQRREQVLADADERIDRFTQTLESSDKEDRTNADSS
ncbi:MAG: cell division protein ZapA [Candidatus Latescibacteria bacterium]|jgi:cell division protein ZapA (FtsZ GTPase activity inhibitor)|nr:cell division protein ZapA [Candidatus Latescibacterota bacterium]